MLEILKMIKALLTKGFATKEEKSNLAAKVKELAQEEQEVVADDAAKVDALPEEAENNDTDEDEVEKSIKTLLTKSTKEVSDNVKSEIKAWLKEQQELMEKKSGIYNPAIAEKRKAKSNKFREAFKATLRDNDTELAKISGITVKELTTDATGSPYGGYLVDTELSAEIRHLMTEYGVARREMQSIQLSKNSYKANELATDVTVYWVDEGAAIGSTQVVLGHESLELKKLGAIVTMTRELLEDQEIDLFSFIAGRIAEKFSEAEDEAFFNGDGSSTYGGFTGLLNATDVNEVTIAGTTFASVDADDLLDMVDATPTGALPNAKYYYHRTIKSIIRKLKASGTGEYIYQAPSQSGPATVWGHPEVLVEVMPKKTDTAADTSFVLFGDLKKACIFGYKGAIVADRFKSGIVRNVANTADTNLITTDREAIRWIERVGYIRIIPTAVTKLTTAAAST